VKKSTQWINLEGGVDWRSFRAPPLEIEVGCDITSSTQIFISLGAYPYLNERILKLRKSIHPSRTKLIKINFFTPSQLRRVEEGKISSYN